LKKAKWIVLLPAIIILLIGNVAFAAGNMTNIEQKWLEFQRAVKDQQVKDGLLSEQDAEGFLQKLESDLNAGSEDVVYQKVKEKQKKCHNVREKAAEEYAQLTNRSKESILKTCEEKKITVWQLAKEEGNLEKLKAALLSDIKEKLSQLVKEGKMTQKEMDEKMDRITKNLSQGPKEKVPSGD